MTLSPHPALPAISTGYPFSGLQCSLDVIRHRRTDLVGATGWVPPQAASTDVILAAVQGYRVGANSAAVLPLQRALYLFIQTGN